jgi:NAD(P)-dependent dehydrogenase (short-subunit alcohol dehydrogenase family)
VGRPDEVARVVASLFIEDVAFLNAATIYVDGGQGPAM